MGSLRRVASLVTLALPALVLLPACGEDEPETYRVAFLRAVPGIEAEEALFKGLERGGVDGDQIEVIGGEDRTETYATEADATEAVARWVADGVDAVIALSTSSAQAAGKAAPDVPILFLSSDPAATGIVRDERRPEGHLTGMSYRVPADRTLALMADSYPGLRRVGCLFPPADPAAGPAQRGLVRAADDLGLTLTCEEFTGPDDADDAARELVGQGVEAIVLVNAPTTSRANAAIAGVLTPTKLPIVSNTPTDFAELVLAPDAKTVYDDLGRQLAQVLRGTDVAKVPVQDPAHFLLVVNETLATANGHAIPASVLREATEVIGSSPKR
jgi:putative ABC transport system substrate-binding protein